MVGCVEQQEREELSRVLAGQVGEDIRKERNTDPLSVTSCHVCEMALTFFWYLFTEDQCQTGHGRGDGGWGCQGLTIFVKWDTTGVERLSEDLGRRLTCLLPQPCPVPSGLWREATLQGTRRARRGPLPAGSAAVASAHQRQLGVVVRRKCFQTIPAGGGEKQKTGNSHFCFHTVSQLAVEKFLSDVLPISYFIIKGKNIAFSETSASSSKSNVLNMNPFLIRSEKK